MARIVLQRSGAEPTIRFGTLIRQIAPARSDPNRPARWFVVTVYHADGGEWLAQIDMHTGRGGEVDAYEWFESPTRLGLAAAVQAWSPAALLPAASTVQQTAESTSQFTGVLAGATAP